MTWIKDVLVDLAVTVLIVVAVTQDAVWARWVVLVYTPLMIVLKGVVLLGGSLLTPKDGGVPPWFFHLLFATNVFVAAFDQWWAVAAGWLVIWALSVAAEIRSRPRLAKRPG